jgi:hypothetical protein
VDLEGVVEKYHLSLDDFARGDPRPVKALFTRRDDVSLANPFGPPVRGWDQVSQALDYASSRFRDGDFTGLENIANYAGADLATILELERWQAKVGERVETTPFVLRVTSTFRREGDSWKLVHRHADPIATASAEGPLRTA